MPCGSALLVYESEVAPACDAGEVLLAKNFCIFRRGAVALGNFELGQYIGPSRACTKP